MPTVADGNVEVSTEDAHKMVLRLAREEGLLVGVSAGEEKDISLSFPANHARADFRGKPAVFRIKVKEVKERVLAALDDDFAKDVGTFQTLAELKEDINKKIEKALKQRAEDTVAELVAKLVEANPIPVPRA